MKKTVLLLSTLLLVFAFSLEGCSWVGQTAGKTQAKIEKKIDAMEDGYQSGYSQEKHKSETAGNKKNTEEEKPGND